MDGLNATGPLFMLCMHVLVPMSLMGNPEDYAEKARRTVVNQAFKEDPSQRHMLNSVTKCRMPVSGRSLWGCLYHKEEDQVEPGLSSRGR